MLIALWLVGGLLSLLGALCYTELATPTRRRRRLRLSDPRVRRPVGFLFAWCQLWIVRPAPSARWLMSSPITPIRFGRLSAKLRVARRRPTGLCRGAVLALTAINMLGIQEGKWTQNILTVVKIVGLAPSSSSVLRMARRRFLHTHQTFAPFRPFASLHRRTQPDAVQTRLRHDSHSVRLRRLE